MSRRLENIPTGFVDYGAAGKGLMEGFQAGRNIALQEEERRRRQQEIENQRATLANNIYRQTQADLERFGNDLTTPEKLAFTKQFEDIVKDNRTLQEFVLKGGKVGSPEYNALQDTMIKKQKNVLMNIGALKEIKDSMNQIVTLQKSKFEGFDDEGVRLKTAYDAILKGGEYVPSIDIPKKTDITGKAYVAPSVVFESVIPKVSVNQIDHVVRDNNKKIIRTEKKQVPVFTDLQTTAYDVINGPAVNSSGVMKNFIEFKNLNKDAVKPEYSARYDLYKMYMNEIKQAPKEIKDFEPVDYSMMEIISRKYKPAPDESEKFERTKIGGTGTQSAKDAALMQQMLDDLFSGNATKSKAVMDKITGGLSTRGWDIGFTGKNVKAQKNPDEWDTSGLTYSFDLNPTNKNKSTAMAMIQSYFTTIGSAGRKQK